MAKTKKKRQDSDNYSDLQQDMETPAPEEEPLDEDETEESESEDVFAEDETDIAMLRKLEEEDTQKALSTICFDEEVGFNPMFEWESVPESEKNRFSTLKSMSKEEVEGYAWKRLNPYQKWMVALACSQHELHEMFREIVSTLISAKKKPAELCMEDIYLELVWDYIATKEYDAALELVDKFEEKFPSEKRTTLRVRGLVLMARGDVEKGKSVIEQINGIRFNDDIPGFETDRSYRDTDRMSGKLQFEVGYSLMNMQMYPLAIQFFERARNLAQLNDDYELIMAIDNARALVSRLKDGENEMN